MVESNKKPEIAKPWDAHLFRAHKIETVQRSELAIEAERRENFRPTRKVFVLYDRSKRNKVSDEAARSTTRES